MAKKITNQCTAKSKQTGNRCKRSATPGKKVCHYHGGAKGTGAPKGNTNTLKHGFYSDALQGDEQEQYNELIRAKPQGPGDEIALLRVKIRRYLKQGDSNNFNFDRWQKDLRKEYTLEVEGKPLKRKSETRKQEVNVVETTRTPNGHELLLKSLAELRKLLMAQWRMDLKVEDADKRDSPEERARQIREALVSMKACHKLEPNEQSQNNSDSMDATNE